MIRMIFAGLLPMLLLPFAARAQSVRPIVASQTTSPSKPQEPALSALKKTIVFIQTDCVQTDALGRQTLVSYSGTGFWVRLEDPKLPGTQFGYLVTNRHVATPGIEHGKPCLVADTKLRLNLVTTGLNDALSEQESLGRVNWILPTDPSVDLAILNIVPDPTRFSYLFLPEQLLLTDQQANESQVAEGDSVTFAGLFIQFQGQKKVEPIVRTGKIAMVPGEPTPTTLSPSGKVYFVDAHVYGGNSGSPAMIDFAGQRNGNITAGLQLKLLGVISGFIPETSDFTLQAVASYAGSVTANSGICVVVPAQQLLDLLHGLEATAARDKVIAQATEAK